MKADTYTLEGQKSKSIELPEQFSENYEPVLVKRMMLISAIVFALLLLILTILLLKPKSPSPSLL